MRRDSQSSTGKQALTGTRRVSPARVRRSAWAHAKWQMSLDAAAKAIFPSDAALTPTQINEQIVLYIMSRVVLSFLPRLYSSSSGPAKGPLEPLSHPLPDILSPEANPRPIPPANVPFAIVATLSWGLVMYIFRHRGERLQPGIVNSMREYGSRGRTKAAPTRLSSDAIMDVAWAIQPCHKHGRAMRAPTLFLPAAC